VLRAPRPLNPARSRRVYAGTDAEFEVDWSAVPRSEADLPQCTRRARASRRLSLGVSIR